MSEYATGAASVETSGDTTSEPAPPRPRQRRPRATPAATKAKPAEKPAAEKTAPRKTAARTTTRTPRATAKKTTPAKPAAEKPAKTTAAKASTTKATTTRRPRTRKPAETPAQAPAVESGPTPAPEPAVAPVVDLAAARAQRDETPEPTEPKPEPKPVPPPPALPALATIIAAPNMDNHYGDLMKALNLLTVADPRMVGMSAAATPQGLRLRSTDYTTAVTVYVDAHFVGDTGEVTLDHDQVKRVLAAMTSAVSANSRENLPVTVGLGANPTVTVNSRTVPLKVRTVEFPDLPGAQTLVAEVQRHELATAAAHVGKSRGRDETLPILTGINVTVTRDGVTLEASDRFRLSRATIAADRVPSSIADRAGGVPVSILVPGDLLARAAAALPTGRVGIGIDVEKGLISLTSGHSRVVINEVGGTFPKTSHFWAKEFGGTVEVPRLEMLNEVKTAIGTAKALNGVSMAYIDLVTDGEEIYVRPVLDAGEFGDGQTDPNEVVDVPKVHAYGEGLPRQSIRFNGKYLTDALESYTGATVAWAAGRTDQMALFAAKLGDLQSPTAMKVLLMSVREAS